MPTTDTRQAQDTLIGDYQAVRRASETLCAGLEIEDYGLQAMPEVSPPKWHLAHTSWFFETFVLKAYAPGYRPFHPQYEYLFNSYYNGVGAQYPRPQRGMLSRPTVQEVYDYRAHVDAAMTALLAEADPQSAQIRARCELGLHHEQQHQELFCTDIKYSFSLNPLSPALARPSASQLTATPPPLRFHAFEPAEVVIGHPGRGFHFDNEQPAHRVPLPGFRFANRLVSNGEYLAFIEAGGYDDPMLWLADGWAWRQARTDTAPLYWRQREGQWWEYTLSGLVPLNPHLPVCHVNYYEADAYARWCGKRLPTEQEWEAVCVRHELRPALRPIAWHPSFAGDDGGISQMFGGVWQWTRSAYASYPGYRPAAGAIGEYNGKFMCNQMVLRGSSCVTPAGHARATYRNFFYPRDQWQFSGIRLAEDLPVR